MAGLTVLHCLAQLPTRTGSGIYYRNLLAEFHRLLPGRQLALYTQPAGLEVDWLAADQEFPLTFSNPDREDLPADLPFPICGMSDEMPYPSSIFSQMSERQIDLYQEAFRRKLQAIRAQAKPDLIICHHLWILARLVLEVFPEVPVLGICHGTDLRQAQQHPEFKDRYVGNLPGLAGVTALSSFQVQDIEETYQLEPAKIRGTGGAYDHRIFYPAPAVPPSREGAINYLYAGKISHAKGVYELAEAFDLVRQEVPEAHLDIVGGPTPEAARELRARSKHNPKIKFWEAEEQKVLAQHMRRSDIFVLPSYYEGLGLIALEALASGLRLVVTDLPALREQMGPELAHHSAISWVPMPPLQNLDEPLPSALPQHVHNLRAALQDQACKYQAEGRPSATTQLVTQHSWTSLAHKLFSFISEVSDLDCKLPPRNPCLCH